MYRFFIVAFAVVGMYASPSSVVAQTRTRIEINNIRVGFPSGGTDARKGMFKASQWAPVYADLTCIRDTEEGLKLTVETLDADEIMTQGSVEISPMVKGETRTGAELGRLPYLKTSFTYSTVNVRVTGIESRRNYGENSTRMMEGLNAGAYLVLGVGSNLNSFRLPSNEQGQNDRNNNEHRNGWVATANITDIGTLPDHWIGYSAVDLLVLQTGSNRAFWEELAAPQHEKKRRAITEWVRRGGRAVLSLGTNVDAVLAMKDFVDILPVIIPPAGKLNVPKLEMAWQVNVRSKPNVQLQFNNNEGQFASAILEPRNDRAAKILIRDFQANEGKTGRPLAVQGSYGLGRVSVLAFDLDRSPFVDFVERAFFWENIFTQAGYQLPSINENLQTYSRNYDELPSALQGNLDFFEGVPVVSFGWVALFILLYILLIGPIDYFFLKKVVKKLEWTWVTFPLIVIVVSTAAYYTAYAIKGNDLKTNKIDLVDMDLISNRVDGHTWFTLFSPRIAEYTLSIEPNAMETGSPDGTWGVGKSPDSAFNSVMCWNSPMESRRNSSGGTRLRTKTYQFAQSLDPTDPNRELYSNTLKDVHIQVWTTKSFNARWTATIDPKAPPVIATLQLGRGNENVLTGTITNMLPVERFSDIALVWKGKVFAMKDLPRGVAKSVTVSTAIGEGDPMTTRDFKNWLNDHERYAGAAPYIPKDINNTNRNFDAGTTSNPNFRIWQLLFHEVTNDAEIRAGKPTNVSLRDIDQSWRVSAEHPEQAMLLLRVPTIEGPGEEITTAATTPSKLWIGANPTETNKRPSVPGTVRQETYIRVIIPVQLNR